MSPPKPFISVTGFSDASQVKDMLRVLRSTGTPCDLGVGVMMSFESLNGLKGEKSDLFPDRRIIKDIFLPLPGVKNVLHYVDLEIPTRTTQGDLKAAVWVCGAHLHVLQLDMPWPSPEMLLSVKERYPDLEFIIQVGGISMEMVDNDVDLMVERLETYDQYSSRPCINYVLFDMSMGKGVPMDSERLIPLIQAVVMRLPDVGIIVAGGLGPNTMQLAGPVVRAWPRVSLDAQRNLQSSDPRRTLDLGFTAEYLRRAAKLTAQ